MSDSRSVSPKVAAAYSAVVDALTALERTFPEDRWQLTFLARSTRSDLDDADVLVSSDALTEIRAAIDKRICAEEEGRGSVYRESPLDRALREARDG